MKYKKSKYSRNPASARRRQTRNRARPWHSGLQDRYMGWRRRQSAPGMLGRMSQGRETQIRRSWAARRLQRAFGNIRRTRTFAGYKRGGQDM